MTIVLRALAAVLVLVGALWSLQGLRILHIRPILCFANCIPVEGPSLPWFIAGVVAMGLGGWFFRRARIHRHGTTTSGDASSRSVP